LLTKMLSGDVINYSVTLVEGKTFRDFRRMVEEAAHIDVSTKGMTDAEVMALLGEPDEHPEGLFYPDTYYYHRDETDIAIYKRAREKLREVLQREWGQRQADLPYKSPYEALIMASIIEKETGSAPERPEIAGVFVRRMKLGMKLQTDPTVIYGLGDRYEGNIFKSHLLEPTPYNTYVIPGLPPTPIANSGTDSIRAALNPAEGDSLFFVARGDGTHHFSATLAEHEAAVVEYQRNRRADYRSSPAPSMR
jgi:UPF0755 protein